jgi:hypothetical protein
MGLWVSGELSIGGGDWRGEDDAWLCFRRLLIGCFIGSLSLDVPEFVNLKQDLENKTVELSIQDSNAQKQKEMWGTFTKR